MTVQPPPPVLARPPGPPKRLVVGLTAKSWAVIGGIFLLLFVGVIGCAHLHASSSPAPKLSPQAIAFLDTAMPALAKVTDGYNAGNEEQAAADWQAIGEMPVSTTADFVVDKDYSAYANNVQFYMLGNGSSTLKQVEDSRSKTEKAIEAAKQP